MAIDRGPWNALVDDDGSNLVGSIWNKAAIKSVILDPADAAFAAVSGTWTPSDGSGAGLVFTLPGPGRYWRLGPVVLIQAHVVYPATAHGASATIAGLPYVGSGTYGGLYCGNGTTRTFLLPPSSSALGIYDGASGLPATNASVSGASLVIAGVYFTT